MAALLAGALAGTLLTLVGLPGLMPLPWGANSRDLRLFDGVSGSQRRREGRADQMARFLTPWPKSRPI